MKTSVFLAAAFTVALTACGKDQPTPPSTPAPNSAPAAPGLPAGTLGEAYTPPAAAPAQPALAPATTKEWANAEAARPYREPASNDRVKSEQLSAPNEPGRGAGTPGHK